MRVRFFRVCSYPSILFLVFGLMFWGGQPGLLAAQQTEPEKANEGTPIRSVVLFNSGAGQFTHAGSVDGTTSITLPVVSEKTDDLLKSLVFDDAGGGKVRGVRYRTSRDQTDVDADTLRNPLTLAQFLQSQRGTMVRFVTDKGPVTGRIFGVENRQNDDNVVETLVVWANGAVQTVPVERLDGLQFVDPAAQKKLESGLLGLLRDGAARHDGLELEFAGGGKRDVQFSYVVDAPVWRMTWRMEIDGPQATLQGWAHVDNDSGSDWDDVHLELRSGRPFLFHARVFQPLMVLRPDFGTSMFEIPRDTTAMNLSLIVSNTQESMYDDSEWISLGGFGGGGMGGMGGGMGGMGGGMGGMGGGGLGGGFGGGMGGQSRREERPRPFATSVTPTIDRAFEEVASAVYQSQTVVLTVADPVNIPAGHSAMVPVFKEKADGVELASLEMALENFRGDKPLQAVRTMKLTNIDTNRLVAGPVAVFRDGHFAGDCVLKKPELNQPLVLQFGIDGDISATDRSSKEKQTIVSVQRRDHKNLVTRTVVQTNSIKFSNSGNAETGLDLKITGIGDWKPVGDDAEQKGEILTAQVQLPAGQGVERTFVLSKEMVTEMPVAAVAVLKEIDSPEIEIDEAVAALVKEHRELTGKIDLLRSEASVLTSEMNELLKEQSRLTQQLTATKEETDLGRVYSEKLLAGEKRLTELRAQIEQKRSERVELESTRASLDNK